jgi:DNA-binding FadR family transcriptional regulator
MSEDTVLERSRSVYGHDAVAARLAAEILSGARPPGSRMPSAEQLFERFGVSRVLVREVAKTLTAKGLIAGKSRVGTVVLPPSAWNWFDSDLLTWRVSVGLDQEFLRHLAQMRYAVEPAAAALAAEQHQAVHIRSMRQALGDMAQAGSDRRAFGEADLAFHIAIALGSGNPLFRSFAGVVETALRAFLGLTTPLDAFAMAQTVATHARIADAIEQRDAAGAGLAMKAVIDEGYDRVKGTA